jgi:mannose-6-phosphate isomerase-like protein (cupin superfamily)
MIKAWGLTERMVATDRMQVEYILVEPGGFCSVHYHNDKDNLFVGLTGCLTVRWGWREGYHLGPCPMIESLTGVSSPVFIPAGVIHQFENTGQVRATAIEVYRPKPGLRLELGDIERFTSGGRNVGHGSGGD